MKSRKAQTLRNQESSGLLCRALWYCSAQSLHCILITTLARLYNPSGVHENGYRRVWCRERPRRLARAKKTHTVRIDLDQLMPGDRCHNPTFFAACNRVILVEWNGF